ncbi:MAG: lactate utilization protein [Ignavibacterium sp.]|nr:MAG: lactate utilization protein [Ignavibacterium sp.]
MNIDIINETIRNLEANNFTVHFFPKAADAVPEILKKLEQAKSISRGGSVTVDKLGIIEKIKERGMPFRDYIKREDRLPSLMAEYYITSSNAVTKDGKLVNMDGFGNRVAAISCGPKQVLIVVGTNKIVNDVDEGIERIKEIAAPLNAKRLNKNTPCVESGICEDCDSPERICRVISIVTRPYKDRVTIYLIDEELGY